MSCYESALETDTPDCLMSVELSELLIKLRRFEKAQQVLEKALEREPSTELHSNKTMRNRNYCSRHVIFVLLLQLLR